MCVLGWLYSHQDTWHHTDMTQNSTLQDASDSLTWEMSRRREHQQAEGKIIPTSAYCCACFLQNCVCKVVRTPNDGSRWRCVYSLQNWFLWTLTNFIQRREEQLKTTSGTYVTNCKKKHIRVRLGTVQYWGILMLLLLLAAVRLCVCSASLLASPCSSLFLRFSSFFFFKEIFVGRIELELE